MARSTGISQKHVWNFFQNFSFISRSRDNSWSWDNAIEHSETLQNTLLKELYMTEVDEKWLVRQVLVTNTFGIFFRIFRSYLAPEIIFEVEITQSEHSKTLQNTLSKEMYLTKEMFFWLIPIERVTFHRISFTRTPYIPFWNTENFLNHVFFTSNLILGQE